MTAQAILDEVRWAKTSAEFTAVIGKLETALTEVKARLASVASQGEAAIFGEGDLAKVQRSMAATEQEIATLQAAIDGARKRHAEAEKQEEADETARMRERAQIEADELRRTREL
jgi:hypothetical protein